jgi:hypothetical protein
MDVDAPLPHVRPVLITLVLDNHFELLEQQIDPSDRVTVCLDDDVALWLRKAGQKQAEPQPGLSERVDTLADQRRGPLC